MIWGKEKKGYEEYMQPLTVEGEYLAKKLAEIEEFKDVDKIISSPTARTISTVKYIAEKYNIPIQLDERIIERQFGNWDEKPEDFFERQWNDYEYKLHNGECLREVERRMIEFLDELLISECGKKVIVSSHGQAIATLLRKLENKIYNIDSPDIFKIIYENKELKKIERIFL